jgi:hypothetical protein
MTFQGIPISDLTHQGISDEMVSAAQDAPSGSCVGWGIPFEIQDAIALNDEIVIADVDPIQAGGIGNGRRRFPANRTQSIWISFTDAR